MTMNREPDPIPVRDEELTAFLDGELDAAASAGLDARLAADADLRARLEFLRGGKPPAEPFDLLLDMAPIGRLEAMLDAAAKPPARTWGSFGGLRALAAAVVLLVLGGAIGFALSRSLAPTDVAEAPSWRAVVADYVALYTPETFALAPADPAAYAPRLALVGDGLGLPLAPETVALPGLDLKGAILFHYDGKPLGQVSYLSTEYGPVAFCIIRNGRDDAPLAFEERRGMNVAFWNTGGLGFLVIGTMPKETLAPLAETLVSRVS
jgi:anti-sigma factor RsiW